MPLRLKWKDGEYKPTSAGLLSISGTTDESCMDDTLPRLATPLAILSGTGSSSEIIKHYMLRSRPLRSI
jgi:hypothetical protein